MINRYEAELKQLEDAGNLRKLRESCPSDIIDMSSNDYLGLNKNREIYEDFMESFLNKKYRFGSTSSRLLSGNAAEYSELEQLIGNCYGKEASLVYNSGYHANIGVIQAIAGKNDLIIADKLVHASIIDGAKLSKADFIRFRHLDYKHLEIILKRHRNNYRNVIIVSESIFSMDGDIADLGKLIDLKERFDCLLYIDEAHAIGVRGRAGLGCSEEFNHINSIDFIIGTFGKALASIGAFVVCNSVFREFLINHSRSFIYTTALPPVNLAWNVYIFKRLPDFSKKRETLIELSVQFSRLLGLESESHIVPVVIGENRKTTDVSELMRLSGFNVMPIKHPTVAKGKARLRFSLNADHRIEELLPVKQVLYESGIIAADQNI